MNTAGRLIFGENPMINRYRATFILLILALGACGALGSAAISGNAFRVHRFVVSADSASLRTRPLIDCLNQHQGKLFFRVSSETLRRDISDFEQVERVTIRRSGFTGFKVDIILRRPILVVTNGHENICLGPGGIPFPYWSEYGELPVFTVPSRISGEQLLEPDSRLLEFYSVVRHLVSHSLENLTCFSTLIHCDDCEIHVMDRQHSRMLRLPRKCSRDPDSLLNTLNTWLNHQSIRRSLELDARFPNTLIVRPWEAHRHG